MNESAEDAVASDVTVVAEDEGTIEILQAKLEKLKSLLLKAKMSISEYKHKAEDLEEQLEEQRGREQELMERVEALESRNPPGAEEIVSALARVRVEGVIWLLLRTVNSSGEWYREDLLSGTVPNLPDILDSMTSTPSAVALQIAGVVKQYEDKVRKLGESLQHSEDTLKDTQMVYKDLQQAYREREAQVRSLSSLLTLVSDSKSLHSQICSLLEDPTTQPDALSPIQQHLQRLSQGPAYLLPESEATRTHVCDLHKAFIDLARRLLRSRKESLSQDESWQAKCDSLVSEKEELKATLVAVRADLSKRTEDLESLSIAIHAHYKGQLTELHTQVEQLTAEAKKAVNLPYLRHVLVQFLTVEEKDVQVRLLHVLATILEISKDELASAQKPSKGVLAKWLGS